MKHVIGPGVLLYCAMLLAACTSQRPAAAVPPPDAIHFVAASWGRPTIEWTIDRSGAGRYRYSERNGSSEDGGFRLVTQRIKAGAAGFDTIRAILRPVERYVVLPCKKRIFDAPYGSISWRRADRPNTLNFDYGCLSKTAHAAFTQFNLANRTIAEWAASAEIIETQDIKRTSPLPAPL